MYMVDEVELFCARGYKTLFHIFMQALFKAELIEAKQVLEWAEETKGIMEDAKEGIQDQEDEVDLETREKFLNLMGAFLKHVEE